MAEGTPATAVRVTGPVTDNGRGARQRVRRPAMIGVRPARVLPAVLAGPVLTLSAVGLWTCWVLWRTRREWRGG